MIFNIFGRNNDTNTDKNSNTVLSTPDSIIINSYRCLFDTTSSKEFVLEHFDEYAQLFSQLPPLPIDIRFVGGDGELFISKPMESGSFPNVRDISGALLETSINDPVELLHEHGHAFDFKNNIRESESVDFHKLKKPFVDALYTKCNELVTDNAYANDVFKRNLIYASSDEEIYARLYEEYMLEHLDMPEFFKRFDTSWYDDVIHETYLTNKEVVDEFISDALSNYLFDYSIKDVSSYQAINKVKDDNITL